MISCQLLSTLVNYCQLSATIDDSWWLLITLDDFLWFLDCSWFLFKEVKVLKWNWKYSRGIESVQVRSKKHLRDVKVPKRGIHHIERGNKVLSKEVKSNLYEMHVIVAEIESI